MNKGLKIFGCVVLGILFLMLFSLATMMLWNWLVPSLFGGPLLNFWQTVGLLVLSKILFSGFGGKQWNNRHCDAPGHADWKGKFYEKFSNMSPAERDALKQKMKEKWCGMGSKSPADDQKGSGL